MLINFDYEKLNIWGFPKGHIKDGENEKQAACREVKEETFIDIEIISGFEEVTKFKLIDNFTIRNRIVKYFIGKPLSTTIKVEVNKLKDVNWVQIDKAKELVTFKCDRIILEKAYDFLNSIHLYDFGMHVSD